MEFNIKIDRKVTIWQSEFVTVIADTIEDVIEKVKADDYDNSMKTSEYQMQYETMQDLPISENGGCSTLEIFDRTNGVPESLIYKNGE